MNYEQKYKEALKVIESLYNVVRYQSSSDALLASQTIEKAFPELAESEDEKIRKEIISIVKSYRESCITEGNHRFDDCISWLEKQGEKTIPKNIDDAALQYVDACAVDGKVTHGNITEPYWNNHSMMAAYKAGWLEKQGKQKLWSEEDEKILNGLISSLARIGASTRTDSTSINYTFSKEIDWLKSLKDRVQPQPKQEWSEEDEKMYSLIYSVIKNDTQIASPSNKKDAIDWLKSLKPRWKPSGTILCNTESINTSFTDGKAHNPSFIE